MVRLRDKPSGEGELTLARIVIVTAGHVPIPEGSTALVERCPMKPRQFDLSPCRSIRCLLSNAGFQAIAVSAVAATAIPDPSSAC